MKDTFELAREAGLTIVLTGKIGREEYNSVTGSLEALVRFAILHAAQARQQNPEPLRRAVKAVVAMLKNGEYAEHWANAEAKGDADAADLEDVITELVSESNEASAAPAEGREKLCDRIVCARNGGCVGDDVARGRNCAALASAPAMSAEGDAIPLMQERPWHWRDTGPLETGDQS